MPLNACGRILPKVYAYADDVNAVIKNDRNSLQALFNEYGRLTNSSGLELNADKTEILKKKFNNDKVLEEFNVNYLNCGYKLKTCEVTKINGIFLQQDPNEMLQINVLKATERMERTFSNWSRRGLSILGKIIIAKTFGISQVIFLMQSLSFTTEHFKKINALLYKFIWNRHFHASKAP